MNNIKMDVREVQLKIELVQDRVQRQVLASEV